MERYKNLGGLSNVLAYKNEPGSICVQFKDGAIYLYTNQSAGTANIDSMKELAVLGKGLHDFINGTAKKMYARRIR
jgi:hypothetical protein